MNTQWMIHTRGDPLGAVQSFIQRAWRQAELEGMLVSSNGEHEPVSRPRLIEEARQMEKVNPFKPLMTVNLARFIPKIVPERPKSQLGALLRPCEMRALVEMVKHDSFEIDNLLTICVDCLGTFPPEEYEWRANRKESPDQLADETLHFARQGGILAYRYRPACQMCAAPSAESADLNIHILGLPVRQHILVEASDDGTAARLKLDALTDGAADEKLVQQHERTLVRLAESHHNTMARVSESLGELAPRDFNSLMAQFETCGECQRCMSVCPICSVDFPQREEDGSYPPQAIMRWLVSCAGCGMCEQACADHLPLSAIFGRIREKLREELGYTAGASWDTPLPL